MASESDNGYFDDAFGDDGGSDSECTLGGRELSALERNMRTAGIRDGIEFGKEDTLQEGFDQGFVLAAARSYAPSKLRGALSAARACGCLQDWSEAQQSDVDQCLSALTQEIVALRDAAVDAEPRVELMQRAAELLERPPLALTAE